MAFRWRIRHKLMMGLGLVAGLIALLLGGTLYGLSKFRATLKSIDSKQAEFNRASEFQSRVNGLRAAIEGDTGNSEESTKIREQVAEARSALERYAAQLRDTLNHARDPDQGYHEGPLVKCLEKDLDALDAALENSRRHATVEPFAASQSSPEDPGLKHWAGRLVQEAADLREAINTNLFERSQEGKKTFQTSVWIVCIISLLEIYLLCVLVRSFYGWIIYPIRDLEAGAERLAQGDFESHIEVRTGDELEDLATAFNNMTGRLRDMYGDLARQVNERSRQLVRSERLAGVGFLAAGVAHEINNPLAGIAFCSEALEARLGAILPHVPGDGEVVRKYLKMIQQEAFRCKAITQRLLEFSRGAERHREPTDLAELVQGVLDMAQHLQNGKGKSIVFEPEGPLVAWVNAQEMKSVVLNLVVNALESMDAGGELRVTLGRRDGMAEISFADTGCGMSPEILENIFEPFFTRSRTGKGTGLGLSISHRVVSQHGGEIEAASPGPNRGSTFTVRLPLQPADTAKEEPLGHAAA